MTVKKMCENSYIEATIEATYMQYIHAAIEAAAIEATDVRKKEHKVL